MDYDSLSKSDSPEPPYVYEEMKQNFKHSGPGIASFVISVVTILGYAVSFLLVGGMASSIMNEAGNLSTDSSQSLMFLGLSVLVLAALNVIGVVIGIIGISLRKRRKVFGIIGTIINGLIILLFMLLVAAVLVNAGAV
ncbi:hypothetical protein [Paenibacillus monticola]|uniref:Uncharacterized protein n=1 Tax=Paenibacillus monticola TaxID=2666075 RepID=A0A7X2L1G8_9BACL|nr:hypothetical protein [Paenibacillus monticola]MRN53095.1 hypothetical protein [Paenibacillus monticola]